MPDQDKVQWGLNPCGAKLAADAAGDVNPAIAVAANILEEGLAAGNQAIKAGSRALIISSPEPIQIRTDSVVEDVKVIGGLWTALNYPWLFLCLLLV